MIAGGVSLMQTPLDLIEGLAALIPPSRRHRHRYYGVLAPNAPLRAAVTALAAPATGTPTILAHLGEATSRPRLMPARGPPLWEMLDAGWDEYHLRAQPAPDYDFDQRIAW